MAGAPGAAVKVHLCIRGGGCRYDVKYGSAGFNSYGYKGGCAFAQGTFQEAYNSPASSRYLCSGDKGSEHACLHDFSGDGFCLTLDNWDGFFRTYQVRQPLGSVFHRFSGPTHQQCTQQFEPDGSWEV